MQSTTAPSQQSRPASTSTRPGHSPLPKHTPYTVNTQTKVLDTNHGRILCLADIRGRLSALNDLARDANAKAIIHTGDFGFFESNSLERINDRTLRHLTMYSPLIPTAQRTHLLAGDNPPSVIRNTVNISLLSEFPLLLSGQIKLSVPVYTVWGACEDVSVLEKFRSGTYNVDNLHVLDEATTRCLDVGGVKLRLLGLGGALVQHKMFDNGDGAATIAGGQGTMWTTALQIGELVDTAQRVFDPTETRLLVSHASPGREGIIAQLALALKADLTISAGLHFRYSTSYNEFSIQGDLGGFRHKLVAGKEAFDRVWDSVKGQVDTVIDDHQRVLLDKALSVVERLPVAAQGTPSGSEEPAWKNCWNWNLCDAAYGSLVLDVKDGRVSAELKSQGFNYAYRRTVTPATAATPTQNTAANQTPVPPTSNGNTPSKSSTPAPTNVNKSNLATPPTNPSAARSPPPASTSSPAPNANTNNPAPNPNANSHHASASSTSAKGGKPAPSSAKDKEKNKTHSVNGSSASAKAGPAEPPAVLPAGNAKEDKEKIDREKAEKEKAEKQEREKAKRSAKKERKERDKAEREETASEPKSGKGTPVPPSVDGKEDEALGSPLTEESRTPTRSKPPRNPWTLFIRVQAMPSDEEVKSFFQDAASGITRINFYSATNNRNGNKVVYIEFGDEPTMKAGLEKHAEKLADVAVEVKQASEPRGDFQDRGSRWRGRGGRGGGFAARELGSAGLRPNVPSHKPSGGEGGGA